MGKFIKYGSFKSFIKSINENEDADYSESNLGYDPVEISRRINRSIIWMNLRKADYADLLSNIDIYGSDAIRPKTMCTDGKRIIFHPEFVASQTDAAIRLVLAHELLHCIGDHMKRRQDRNPLIWNWACDYAINPILDGEDFGQAKDETAWPKNADGSTMGLLEEKYSGMRAEDIYEIIKDMPPPKNEQDLGNVVDEGTPLPGPSEGLEIQIEEGEDEFEETGEDEYDDTPGGSEEDDNGEAGDGEEDDDESGGDEEGGEAGGGSKVHQAKVGDLIKSKDGRYGKITSINSDGTHDIDEMTEEEVKMERAASSGRSNLSDLADVNEI
jgi:hypothetical protein